MQVLVLSPHRDDAAFSCGLLLHALLASGAAISIVNVCSISNYAPYLAEQGEADRDVTGARYQEDIAFAGRLLESASAPASALALVDLAWKDAPLRWTMEDEGVLAPHLVPDSEVELLSEQMRALERLEIVLAPLALGGHVDHRLVHLAALNVYHESQLIFYEDLPYACRLNGAERETANEVSRLIGPSCLLPRQSVPGLKRELALCYPSQIAAEVAEEMDVYADRLGGRERFCGASEAINRLQAQLANDGVALHP